MKKIILLSIATFSIASIGFSQCDPQTSVTNIYEPVGFIPLPTDGKLVMVIGL